ncbi:Efflux transporter, outer membrane factor lipoprotein, NodT family [Candidatus Sulfotelmatomonas gaucii]|uniref:Efflux transporter, outer membrane factor lipoprotein, NodT family n=1 Tax=Candidatus Sulfuritelmatomonas gaucii TaxID=2043161 RepID=A0A2N9LI95_9BACT|nr:Efflux transporter, outer membrane factor lipoprotein, NodT family [Candidatus Sulfotelmatomonas gaucii]
MLKLKNRMPISFSASMFASLVLLGGCRVGPPYHAPAPPAVTAPNYKESTVNFHDTGGWKVASPQDAMIRGNWWEVFNEPELNALEEQLNVNNETLKEDFQNYMAARAVIAEARSLYWPTITASPSWNRSKTSANQRITSTATTGNTTSLWNLPIDVSWTPDFWGKIRNEVHEAQYAAQVSAADLQVEKLTEQASLANYFFEIRGQDMLEQILKETVAADQRSLDYNQAQFDTGVGDYISVAEAKTTLEAAEAAEVNVGLLRAQYEHAIAVLLGKAPSDFSIPERPMVYTPPPIPTGVPSQLAERRPDVAAAERTLAQENAVIGIGYGAFFPQVTISASGGFESATFKHLFDIDSRTWSVGPSISQVLFNGFLYRAELHQYVAQYNADVAIYRQSVLVAFQQVEDALAATRVYSQQILRQQQAVKDAQDYLNLELVRYNTGVDPYVDVVIAQTTLLTNQETLNALEVNEMTSSVDLVQTLGGGWDRTQLPTPEQAGAKTTNADYQLQQ